MTELKLYKYITDNKIKWHRHDNNGEPDIIMLLYTFELEEFVELVKDYNVDEGIECRLKNGYLAFWMRDLCDYYDIYIDNVFID